MTDQRKLTVAVGLSLLFAALAFGENLGLGEYVSGLVERNGRQDHYERVLMKKGLSMHEGEYWKNVIP